MQIFRPRNFTQTLIIKISPSPHLLSSSFARGEQGVRAWT
jgi:hypothetical protein